MSPARASTMPPRSHSGRPRDPAIGRAILDAVMELLARDGYGGMSIEAVARRASVGKPSIYRRWPSKPELVMAALKRAAEQAGMPEGGPVRERLASFMDSLGRVSCTKSAQRLSSSLRSLLGEIGHSPQLARAVKENLVMSRRRKIIAAIREGKERGELRPDLDVDLAADMLLGPLLIRRLITGSPAPDGSKAVDILCDGAAMAKARRRRASRPVLPKA